MSGGWALLTATLTFIGGLVVVIGGIYTARSGHHASPYDSLADRVTTLEQQRVADTRTIEDQQTEISGLKRRMSVVIEDRDALVQYILIFREWVANGSRPPTPQVPRHLAKVIPEWVAGDGAEIPHPRSTDPTA